MDDIESELHAKIVTVLRGVGLGGVSGDADLAGGAKRRFAFEGDHISGGCIIEKLSVQPSDCRIGQEHDRQFSGRRTFEKAFRGIVQYLHRVPHGLAVDAQARVLVADVNFANHGLDLKRVGSRRKRRNGAIRAG